MYIIILGTFIIARTKNKQKRRFFLKNEYHRDPEWKVVSLHKLALSSLAARAKEIQARTSSWGPAIVLEPPHQDADANAMVCIRCHHL